MELFISSMAFLFLLPFLSNSQIISSKYIKYSETISLEVIRSIFKNYIRYQESTESDENKLAMKSALTMLNTSNINKNGLPLLINVWMYYDPTDFGTRDIVTPIFIKNKTASLIAIKYRIKHKKKWESKDSAPYSELFTLENDLSK